MTRTAPQRRAVTLAAIAAAALMGGGIDPTPQPTGAAPEAGALPSAGTQVAPAPSAAPGSAAEKGAVKKSEKTEAAAGKAETLPWAKAGADKSAAKPSGAPSPTTTAALSACLSMGETACRDAKKECAWIADVKLDDGNVVPARCVGRMPAPPKKKTGTGSTSKKSETAKAVEKTPAPATAAPAPPVAATTDAAAPSAPASSPIKVQVAPPADGKTPPKEE